MLSLRINTNTTFCGKKQQSPQQVLEKKELEARRKMRSFLTQNGLPLKTSKNGDLHYALVPNVTYIDKVYGKEVSAYASDFTLKDALNRLCRDLSNTTITIHKDVKAPNFFDEKA